MGFESLVPIHTCKHSLTAFSFLNLVFGAAGCLNAFPTSRAIIWPNLLGDVGTRGREQRKWEKQRAINISNS